MLTHLSSKVNISYSIKLEHIYQTNFGVSNMSFAENIYSDELSVMLYLYNNFWLFRKKKILKFYWILKGNLSHLIKCFTTIRKDKYIRKVVYIRNAKIEPILNLETKVKVNEEMFRNFIFTPWTHTYIA